MRFFKRALPLTLTFILILLLCACSSSVKSSKHEMSEAVVTAQKDTGYAKARKMTNKQKVAVSSMTELYFDEETGDIAVKNANTGKWWYSLPEKYNQSGKYVPSVLSAQAVLDGQIIELNSCRDKENAASVKSEKIENGVKATYTLKCSVDEGTVSFSVPVEYTLVDGNFYVNVNTQSIENTSEVEGVTLTKVRLLDFFGSDNESPSDEYMLVPDNSGAIIKVSKSTEKFKDVSLKIYGDEEGNNALFGVFGMKKSSDAYVCIIGKGDAIATVNAGVAKSARGYNSVGAEFAITETKTLEKKDKTYIYVSGETYEGELELCYRFLSGDNASYSGMAVACREQLIRDGVLSSGAAVSDGALPTVISVLASASSKQSKTEVLTTYEQLQDMLIHLKSKGFANIYVKYKNALSGSDNQISISSADMIYALGDEEQYKELTEYMSAQNLTLFTDISCFTVSKGSESFSKYAKSISGKNVEVKSENAFGVVNEREVIGLDAIEKNVISLLTFARDNEFEAICVSDAAKFLYSDGEYTRDDVKNEISAEISSVSGTSRLMVEKGNLYALKNAEVVSDVPLEPSRQTNACYQSVPFYQLVLHGTLEYSCEPINLSSDYKKSMLRAVEYGALLAFEWCYEDLQTKIEQSSSVQAKEASQEDEAQPYSYTQWANIAFAFYDKANKALGDLRDSRMTDHYTVKTNVYCTQYGDTKIYVNYTENDVTVNGVTVPAQDFMRIN